MNVFSSRGPRCGLAGVLAMLAAACTDGLSTAPEPAPVPAVGIPALSCEVDVQGQAMACTPPAPLSHNQAIVANRLLGGQDVYVKLLNTGGSYDAGAGIFEINVTLQNLLAEPLGTTDGTTVTGVKVFFPDPPSVTGGTGEVDLVNDSTAFITGPDQSYFLYREILGPYEISASQPWRFSVPGTVTRFRFNVYVYGPQANESQPLLDRVWDGSTSSAWSEAGNWAGNAVPDSASSVAVPPDSLLPVTAQMPVLGAATQITDLRVGYGSTLGLGGHTLTAWGNVDASGTLSGGTLWMRGRDTKLNGSLSSLQVTGTVTTQGTTRVTGTLLIRGGADGGTLTVSNHNPLTIINPNP